MIESVFLVCFLVGLGLTLVSLLLGATHGGDAGHAGLDAGHGLHLGHGAHGAHGADVLHGSHAGHAGNIAHGGDAGHGGQHGSHTNIRLGFLNTTAITAFLTWFGGIGYILLRGPALPDPLAALGAVAGGVVGAAGVNYFLHNVLSRGDTTPPIDEERELPGTGARVTSAIYGGEAGEITYALAGTTRSASARSMYGLAIPRDTEVVILKVERGVAYVETWERALDEPNAAQLQDTPPPVALSPPSLPQP